MHWMGGPGVYSARYAGEHASQEEILNKLLNEMEGIPDDKRTAQFVCVLTAILKDGQVIVARGETKGKISKQLGPMGKLTYGPVFIPDEFGRVMNELGTDELKHTHRKKALAQLLKELKEEENTWK